MKHHQQPTSPVVFEVMILAGTVPKPEGDSGFSGQLTHGESPRAYVAPWSRNVALPMDIHYRRCPDAGVECLGCGEVLLKVQVVPRVK